MNIIPKQKTALITGAAQRLGRVTALHMARAGWNIVVHYRHSMAQAQSLVAEIQALGLRSCALPCELSDAKQVENLFAQAVQNMGAIHCVVNNASVFEEDQAQNFTPASLDLHMHSNLLAPMILARSLHEHTPDGAQACVINILDQKLVNLNPDYLSYTLSKAALQCATVTLAQAFAPKLRVIGVSPGLSLASGSQSQADFQLAQQVTALGYSSTPEDIARTVCFIAESPAITGTTIVVDGGQHLIPLARDVMFLAKSD
jgi:NAD(P)-dependent dehydrogenase (short-subunit alcohol dehydrogenase family)